MVKVRKVSTNWSELPGGLTYYFIGQPKTGKTTASSRWSTKGTEGVLLLDTDLGSDFVEGANVITVTSLNIPMRPKKHEGKQITSNGTPQTEMVPNDKRGFYYRSGKDKGKQMPVYSMAEVYQWLNKDFKKLPYDTIVIDTMDEVNRWVEETVCQEMQIDVKGQGSWGSDWGAARRKNVDIIKRFQQMIKREGGNLILISHAKQSVMTDDKVQLMPELPRGLAYSLTAKADVIGYSTASKDDGNYYISFKAYDERAVGSRLRPLAQETLPFEYQAIKDEILNYVEES